MPIVVCGALALGACGTGGGGAEAPGPAVTSAAVTGASSSPPDSETPTGAPLPAYHVPTVDATAASTFEQRCGTAASGSLMTFRGSGGSRLDGAVLGAGPTVAIFLHQTEPAAMCGWGTYAAWVSTRGVRAVLVDLCGHGASTCSPALSAAPVDQVRLVVDWVRAHGATRVVLVGASMGGAVALGSAQAVGADALVDLSGPAQWDGVPDGVVAARHTTIPMLLAVAPSDMSPEPFRAAITASPARHKVFVEARSGHGWDLVADVRGVDAWVSSLGDRVLRWVTGDYGSWARIRTDAQRHGRRGQHRARGTDEAS